MTKIMFVDDDAIIRRSIANKIDWKGHGWELVYTARDPMEALDYLRDHQPDIILTDIKMPGISGIEMASIAMDYYPGIKFIFISVGVTITGIAAYKFYQDTSDIEVDDRSLITTDDKFEKISTASNDTLDSEHSDEEQLSTSVTRDYTPNTVPAHSQRYHTKQGVKTIMKEPYSRGQSEDFEDDDFHEIDDSESIDVYDAAEIWISNGMDPDYTFGFTEEELKRAME